MCASHNLANALLSSLQHVPTKEGMSCRAHLAGLGQLDQALLEVGEGALHQAARLLEVVQQRIPQRLLAQDLQ